MKLLNPRKKSLRMRRLEEALVLEYEEREIYQCAICNKPFLGGYMRDHLSKVHARGGAFRRALSPAARKALKSARPVVGSRVARRTKEQADLDRKNAGKPALVDGHVPGSNLRKIER